MTPHRTCVQSICEICGFHGYYTLLTVIPGSQLTGVRTEYTTDREQPEGDGIPRRAELLQDEAACR